MLQLKSNATLQLDGYTIIIPSICVGNAAQLACDLLISSKQLRRIGTISHPALIPLHGPSAFQHEPEEHAAACEVYEGAADKMLVIQLRTPLISRHTADFHKSLAELVQGARRVVVLSGSFGFEKRTIEATPYEYCATKSFKEAHGEKLQRMQWKEFTGEQIFGGGNALALFQTLEKQGVPTMVLLRYLLDGDNSLDASLIVRELSGVFEYFLEITAPDGELKLTVPVSWKLLFGNEVTELIF